MRYQKNKLFGENQTMLSKLEKNKKENKKNYSNSTFNRFLRKKFVFLKPFFNQAAEKNLPDFKNFSSYWGAKMR